MSDVTVTNGAPSIVVDPAAKPAPSPQPSGEPSEKPTWLDARLERERRSVLKELGIDSLEAGKSAIAEAQAKREAEKTDAQKRGELEATLKKEQAEKQAMADALSVYAKSQMSALTEAQRKAVADVAGDDAAMQLKTITALQPTWASAAAPAATVVTPAPQDTAPAPAAPKDGNTSPPPDVKAIHAELKKTNPILAARYATANGVFDH